MRENKVRESSFLRFPKKRKHESTTNMEGIIPTAQKSFMQPGLPGGGGPDDLEKATQRRGKWHWNPKGEGDNNDNEKHEKLSRVGVIYAYVGVASAFVVSPFILKITYPFFAGASASRFGDSQKLEYDPNGMMSRFYNGFSFVIGVGFVTSFVLTGNPILLTPIASFLSGFIFGKITRKNLW